MGRTATEGSSATSGLSQRPIRHVTVLAGILLGWFLSVTPAEADEPAGPTRSELSSQLTWFHVWQGEPHVSLASALTVEDMGACRTPSGPSVPSAGPPPQPLPERLMVERMVQLAAATIAELETTLRLAGLDPAEVAPRHGAEARSGASDEATAPEGGPYVVPGDGRGQGGGLAASLAALGVHLNRWDELNRVIRSLPLAEPLREFHLASSFGIRLDPFLRRPAVHEGIDLAARYGTPVFATAGGKVIFAGVRPGYGRSIEVDHGHGVHTLYAHLRTLLVREGARVGRGTRIGRLGSSGRSTGPHLHYEVRVNGLPRDPAQFLYLGRLMLAKD